VSALGFRDHGASLKDIYERASRLGLALAPAELGPTLRLDYLDQPLGEFLHIAMKPVTRDGGDPVDFTIGNGGAGLLLISGDAHSDSIVPGSARFVFVRPRDSGRIAQGPIWGHTARGIAPNHLDHAVEHHSGFDAASTSSRAIGEKNGAKHN
jgi:hypothetical protein